MPKKESLEAQTSRFREPRCAISGCTNEVLLSKETLRHLLCPRCDAKYDPDRPKVGERLPQRFERLKTTGKAWLADSMVIEKRARDNFIKRLRKVGWQNFAPLEADPELDDELRTTASARLAIQALSLGERPTTGLHTPNRTQYKWHELDDGFVATPTPETPRLRQTLKRRWKGDIPAGALHFPKARTTIAIWRDGAYYAITLIDKGATDYEGNPNFRPSEKDIFGYVGATVPLTDTGALAVTYGPRQRKRRNMQGTLTT